jgi:hypothetical protein
MTTVKMLKLHETLVLDQALFPSVIRRITKHDIAQINSSGKQENVGQWYIHLPCIARHEVRVQYNDSSFAHKKCPLVISHTA